MHCPTCKGTNVTKNAVAYANGFSVSTHQNHSAGIGVGIGGGHVGIGGGVVSQSGETHTLTALAMRLAPPEAPIALFGKLCFAGFISVTLFFVFAGAGRKAMGLLVFLLGITSLALIFWHHVTRVIPRYREALRQWESQWICLQCGEQWQDR